ncbi:hypothetical protein M406DRAFT_239722, partial [Cryphonectria parasitica EP155]
MGGKAFSSGPRALYTPRMIPEVYETVLVACLAALRPLFPAVKSLVEAPEKTSHGDIDILVCLEDSSCSDKTAIWAQVEAALKALAHEAAGNTSPVGQDEGGSALEPKLEAKTRCIQVDIRLCATSQELEWRCFKHAHGDLWIILGSILRPFGLTVDEEACYIRIPEIENQDRKKARVFLTDNPTDLLDFLALEHEAGQWTSPFPSVDEMFEYAASCRWFTLWPEAPNNEAGSAVPDGSKDREEASAAKVKLDPGDRERMSQRAVFARWVEDFIPHCLATGRFVTPDPQTRTKAAVRDQVRRLAFEKFPGSEARYTAQLAAWNREKARIFVKNKLIKHDMAVPEDISHIGRSWRGGLRSALVQIIVEDENGFQEHGIETPQLRDEHGVLVVDRVKTWIEENWEDVGRAAWSKNCTRASQWFRIKKERETKRAE